MHPWNRIENFGNFALKILGIFVSLHPNCCIIYVLSETYRRPNCTKAEILWCRAGGRSKVLWKDDNVHALSKEFCETDAVVHLDDGRWGGIEIKLGGDDLIKEGAESLLTLRNKIVEKSDEKAPSFLLVLTAVGGAYQREDGVYVAPINLLKP